MKNKIIPIVLLTLVVGISGAYAYRYFNSSATSKVVFISGTEYQQGEAGQTIVRIVNAFGIPQSSVNGCNVTIWYPDKTVFVDNQPMTQGGTAGSYYYQFTTPFTQIGVYEEYVQCNVTLPSGKTRLIGAGSSFHVSQALTTMNETASAIAKVIS